MVTHGGLSTIPSRPDLISFGQYVHGTGDDDAFVDAQFDAQAPPGWVQIHGHRNPHQLPTQASPRSFNLAGEGARAGALRGVVLDARGFVVEEMG